MDQTGILTSEICLRTLSESPSAIDFSASIVPLMKVLERALIDRFYLPYLKYLKMTYPNPQDYIDANGLEGREDSPEKLRYRILYYNKKQDRHIYKNGRNRQGVPEFTLGNYQYTVGAENYSRNACDATAAAFYRDTVFGPSADPARVVRWICRLARDLDSMVDLRNSRAHAGVIQSEDDANTTMNTIIKIDQVLFSILSPSLT